MFLFIDSSCMSGTKDEGVTTIMYDPGIRQEQNPVTGQLYATIVKKDDKASSVDFPFYNVNMVQKVPVSGNIAVLAAASANGVTQTDKTSYRFDVTAPFNYNYALVNQMSLTTAGAAFKCDVCGAGFTHASMLDHHKKSAHPQEPPSFTCSTCGSCFPQVRDMKVHRSTVHKQCFSCGADVAPQTVKGKKSRFIKCVSCSGGNCSNYTPQENEIESSDNLSPEQTAIMKGYYPVKKRGMATVTKCYKCNGSGIIFLVNGNHTNVNMKNDSINNSNTPNKPFHCNICGGSFSRYSSLWSHKRLHTGDKPYKCEICGLSFAKAAYLKNHGRVHTGEKPFKCGVCGMQFSQSPHLKNHERIHSGERPYQCEVCDKTFARHSTLWNHRRIHTGEKPYRCDICGSAFNQATHLKNHAKVHTGEKPHRCDICGVGFSDRFALKRHRNIHEKYARQQSDAAAAHTVTPPSQELEPISGQTQIEECIYSADYTVEKYDAANNIPTDIVEVKVDQQNQREHDTQQQQIEDCIYK